MSAALLAALGTTFVAQAARAQQAYTGSVLGIEYADGDRCNITLISSEGQTITEVTDALTCDSVLVGNRIQIVRDLVAVEVLPSPETGTVTRVENGDRACYIGLTDADNNTFVQFADFSICQQDLVGARVQLTYGTTDILARSCQGDVDCGRTEAATIITQADVIDRPTTVTPPTTRRLSRRRPSPLSATFQMATIATGTASPQKALFQTTCF